MLQLTFSIIIIGAIIGGLGIYWSYRWYEAWQERKRLERAEQERERILADEQRNRTYAIEDDERRHRQEMEKGEAIANEKAPVIETSPLVAAIGADQTELAVNLIRNGVDVNETGPSNITPLHIAVQKGNPDIVEALIDHDANVNAVTEQNRTPLFFLNGNITDKKVKKIVELLTDAEANINHADADGKTMLQCMVSEKQFGIAEILSKFDAK